MTSSYSCTCFSILCLSAGLGLGVFSGCSQSDSSHEPAGLGLATAEMGSVELGAATWLTAWYGSEDDGSKEMPDRLVDLRKGWVSSAPGHFVFELPQVDAPRQLQTAVLPTKSDSPDLHCEVFWQGDGNSLSSLAQVTASWNGGWVELRAELPQTKGKLVCLARPTVATQKTPQLQMAWAGPMVVSPQTTSKTDVLVLSIDTLRADALKHMPFLSKRLEQGALWSKAISPSSWTLPAYASLMTSLPTSEHGAGRDAFPTETSGLTSTGYHAVHPHLPTLAEAFQQAGYTTGMLYQNPFLEPWSGLAKGFQHYFRIRDRVAPAVQSAQSWWKAHSGQPRFFIAQFLAPHLPYEPIGLPDLPPDPLQELDWRSFLSEDHTLQERRDFFRLSDKAKAQVRELYYAECRALDLALEAWLSQALDPSTGPVPILALHVDHGEELWDDGNFEHGHSFQDSVIRVPMGIVWPNHIEASVSPAPVPVAALGSTLLKLAEIKPPGVYASFDLEQVPPSWRANLFDLKTLPNVVESRGVLFRSEHEARLFQLKDSTRPNPGENDSKWLPFQGHGANGPTPDLGEAVYNFLAELGY